MQRHSALIPYQIVMSLTIYAISMPHHHIQIRLQKAKKQPPSYPWILPRNSWFSCQKVHRRLQIRFCKCLTFWKAINRNYSCLFPNVPTNETSFIKWLQKYQKSLISCEIRLLMELLGRFELPTSSLPTAIRPFYRTFSGVISCYCVLNEDFSELWCSQIIPFCPICSRIVPRRSRDLFPNCSQSDNFNWVFLGYNF